MTSGPAPIQPLSRQRLQSCSQAHSLPQLGTCSGPAMEKPGGVWKAEETRAVLVFPSPSLRQQPAMETPVILESAFPSPVTNLVGVEKPSWQHKGGILFLDCRYRVCAQSQRFRGPPAPCLDLREPRFPPVSRFCRVIPVGPVLILLPCTRSGKLCRVDLLQPTTYYYKYSFIGTRPCFIHPAPSPLLSCYNSRVESL